MQSNRDGSGQQRPSPYKNQAKHLFDDLECFNDSGRPYIRFTGTDGRTKTADVWDDTELLRANIMLPLSDNAPPPVPGDTKGYQRGQGLSIEQVKNELTELCLAEEHTAIPNRIGVIWGVEDPSRIEKVVYDLGSDTWEAYEVSKSSIECVQRSPLPFRRPKNGLALRIEKPPAGDNRTAFSMLSEILPLDYDSEVIRLGFILACLWPVGPFPLLRVLGPSKSNRRSLGRLIRGIVDPCSSMTSYIAEKARDQIFEAWSHRLVCMNLPDVVPGWFSNVLWELSEGTSIPKKKSYSDLTPYYNTSNPAMVMALQDWVTSSDLIENSLKITLPYGDSVEDQAIDLWLLREGPYLRYRLLELIQAAISDQSRDTGYMGRMSHLWALMGPVEGYLGLSHENWSAGTWSRACHRNSVEFHSRALDEFPWIKLLLQEMAKRKRALEDAWSSDYAVYQPTVGNLLDDLERLASERQLKDPAWPKSDIKFRHQLAASAAALGELGVEVRFEKRKKIGKVVTLIGKSSNV